MKKFNLVILMTIITAFINNHLQANSQNALGSHPLAENIDYTVYKKKVKLKRVGGTLEFTPENNFGGSSAQGIYDYNHKTAKITNGNLQYNFTMIVENPSPELVEGKDTENLVKIGSFVNMINRGMPVMMYLFGQLTDKLENQL